MNAKNSRQTKQTPGSVKCSSFTPSLPGDSVNGADSGTA